MFELSFPYAKIYGKKWEKLNVLTVFNDFCKIKNFVNFVNNLWSDTIDGSFSFSPHLQIFTCNFFDDIVQLLWKFTYRVIRPWQTYLVFILNLVKPLVTLIYWSSYDVGGGGGGGGGGRKKSPFDGRLVS